METEETDEMMVTPITGTQQPVSPQPTQKHGAS